MLTPSKLLVYYLLSPLQIQSVFSVDLNRSGVGSNELELCLNTVFPYLVFKSGGLCGPSAEPIFGNCAPSVTRAQDQMSLGFWTWHVTGSNIDPCHSGCRNNV